MTKSRKTDASTPRKPVPVDAVEYLQDADRIQQRPMPFFARSVMYLITLLIIAAVAWASFSTIDSYVTARGKIITEGSHVVLQPLETSIVRKMNVRKGEVVAKGTELIAFDPTFAGSDKSQLGAEYDRLSAQVARLEAEAGGVDYTPVNPSPYEAQEVALHSLHRQERASRTSEMRAERDTLQASILRLERRKEDLSDQLTVVRELEEMKQKLTTNGSGSRASYLNERLKTLSIERELTDTNQQIAETQMQIRNVTRSIESYTAGWQREVMQLLIESRAKRNETQEQLRKAERRAASASIIAPFEGYVLDVADRDTGSVVGAAEAIVTLVPTDQTLLAEIWIPARDIGKVSVGDHVRIKVESFPFQRHGIVEGEIQSLSGDSFVGSQDGNNAVAPGEVHFLARVSIPPIDEALTNLPKGFHALPGMTLNAEVQVGQRQVISYFLYPIFRMLDESIRES
ncbi:MAG: HlyD family type I secretion periplasmic adaptor subunit [Pseudomonadota bacterium]